MYLESMARRAEAVAYLRTEAGKREYSNTIALFDRAVDEALEGLAVGSDYGLWALIVEAKPGAVGYSGRGAGADEFASGARIPSASEIYQREALTLPPPRDPVECHQLHRLLVLATTRQDELEALLERYHGVSSSGTAVDSVLAIGDNVTTGLRPRPRKNRRSGQRPTAGTAFRNSGGAGQLNSSGAWRLDHPGDERLSTLLAQTEAGDYYPDRPSASQSMTADGTADTLLRYQAKLVQRQTDGDVDWEFTGPHVPTLALSPGGPDSLLQRVNDYDDGDGTLSDDERWAAETTALTRAREDNRGGNYQRQLLAATSSGHIQR